MKPILLCLLCLLNCEIFVNQKEDNTKVILFIALGILSSAPEAYARMYYIDPIFLENTNDLSLLKAIPTEINNTKKKIVFIHGWNVRDPEVIPYPSEDEIKLRIKSQWEHLFIEDPTFLRALLLKNYELYFFTYLTSQSIESNGIRFRNKLDGVFGGQSQSVTIFAHSMGGLVSRISLYREEIPSYLRKIITSGTPFHGSPWASPEYQQSKEVIGELSSFMTNTSGGKGLAWDNFDSSIPGAKNELLTYYNSNTTRDYFIRKYYSSISADGTGYSGTLLPGCLIMGPVYSPSDCIVPKSSAILNNNSDSINIGIYDHIEMNLRAQAVKSQLLSDLP